MPIRAVGFDIDGTLYPNYRFHARVLPVILSDLPLLLSMGKARDELRAGRHAGRPFYQAQAELAVRHYRRKRTAEEMRDLLDERVYRAWEPIFARVKPFAHARRTILGLREKGYRVGVLSDFPAERKLELLGLSGLWDAVLCSEEVGRLKPAPEPFLALAEALGSRPGEILYVGNSPAYDVAGAKAAGMMAACVSRRGKTIPGADLSFSSYRQLEAWILGRREDS